MSESLLLTELPQFTGHFHAWSLGYFRLFMFVKQPRSNLSGLKHLGVECCLFPCSLSDVF